MFLLYAVILVIPLFLFWLHHKRTEEDLKVGIPGPKGWPFLGAIFEFQPYLKKQNGNSCII